MPIYLIAPTKAEAGRPVARRLVRARTQAEALRFVARSDYSVAAASAEDVADTMTAGVRLEQAVADPADAEQLDLPTTPAAPQA